MIRWFLRLTAFPMVLVLTILEWCGSYIVCFAGMLCKLLAGIIFVLSVTAYLMGMASDKQIVTSLLTGFVVFILPKVVGIMVGGVTLLNAAIMNLLVE